MGRFWRAVAGITVAGIGASSIASAQVSLAPIRASGQSVTPAYEGWYRNADGTYSLSFGFFNRNSEEVVEIPVGPANSISPGQPNQGQPTSFSPRRHWGVFTVVVPANFGAKNKVTWTLKNRGEDYAISGSLDPLWEIDALQGEAGSDNTPPGIKFAENGPEGRGPGGVTAGPLTVKVNTPLALTIWARDDGKSPTAVAGRGSATPVSLTYFKHQGPGPVTFAPATGRVAATGGSAAATATFTVPGDYILRVRANDASGVAGAGHAQCCWTNGFIKVTVTP